MKKEKSRTFEDFYLGQLKSVYDRKDKFNKQLEIRNQGMGGDSEIAREDEIHHREFEASQEYFLQEMNQQESPNQFFLKLIQTFDRINFYNLLFFKGEKL
jgi:hypothetical protein